MGQIALTIWFTIATLCGPVLCCCNRTVAAEAPKAASAPKPTKSCCAHEPAPVEEKAPPAPHEKPKCPCGNGNAIADLALPSGDETSDDIAAQFLVADTAFLGAPIVYRAIDAFDFAASPSDKSHPLSGRALLAAYSTLRC